MFFDGLGDVFGALGAKKFARKVEGRQRLVILDGIGQCNNTLGLEFFSFRLGIRLAPIRMPVSIQITGRTRPATGRH